MTMTLKNSTNITYNKSNIPRGIIFGYNTIPIDHKILESLTEYGLTSAEI